MISIGFRWPGQAEGINILEVIRERRPRISSIAATPLDELGKEMAAVFTTISSWTSSAKARRIRNGRFPSFA